MLGRKKPPYRKPIPMPEKHWSELGRVKEKREIKWLVGYTVLSFWSDEAPIREDFLTSRQQLTFDRVIVLFRDSLQLAFPRISSAATRIELHGILDQVVAVYERNKSASAAHMLRNEFEAGIFEPKQKQHKGRPPKRDVSMGDLASAKDVVNYIDKKRPILVAESFQTNEKIIQSVFAQLLFGVKFIYHLPKHFERRVYLLRLLDQVYVELEFGNQDNAVECIKQFQNAILPKTMPQKFLEFLMGKRA